MNRRIVGDGNGVDMDREDPGTAGRRNPERIPRADAGRRTDIRWSSSGDGSYSVPLETHALHELSNVWRRPPHSTIQSATRDTVIGRPMK